MRKLIIGAAGGVTALLTMATTVSANGYTYYSNLNNPVTTSTGAGALAATTAFGGLNLLLCCCGVMIPAILVVILAVFIYKDAKKNNVENATLWVILALFPPTSVISVLIYLLAIRPDAVKKNDAMKADKKSEDNK